MTTLEKHKEPRLISPRHRTDPAAVVSVLAGTLITVCRHCDETISFESINGTLFQVDAGHSTGDRSQNKRFLEWW